MKAEEIIIHASHVTTKSCLFLIVRGVTYGGCAVWHCTTCNKNISGT